MLNGRPGLIDYGVLECKKCAIGLPVIKGFLHADESMLTDQRPTLASLKDLETKLLPRISDYEETLRSIGKRSYDIYAAFQPFNESTRALYPFLEHLRRHLRPGDLILDTWCRTGFTGALLAGLFPEQHIVSLWEGNLGALGYAGFHHWLRREGRAPNWDIIFTHPAQGLPFADGSFALVHALDSLHRYPFSPFLSDCLRTATKRGALVWPHIHLSNSEPEPFFERGGVQLHGEQYRQYFEHLLAAESRQAFVLSEHDLFELDHSTPLCDQAQTSHYNGFIAILDKDHATLPLKPSAPMFSISSQPIPQPLVVVHESTGAVLVDAGIATTDLLNRHPCYAKRLEQFLPAKLSSSEIRIWSWIKAGGNWAEIGAKLNMESEELRSQAEALERAEMLTTLPIGKAMSRLQTFHATRKISPLLSEQRFGAIWEGFGTRYAGRDVLKAEDGSAFGADDVQEIVHAMNALFTSSGVRRGDRVVIVAGAHAEAILSVWACWLCGAVVVPLDPAMPEAQRQALIERLAPRLILKDEIDSAQPHASRLFCLYAVHSPIGSREELSSLVSAYLGATPIDSSAQEGDPAAILYTSGSTGKPKGVVICQGALYRGSETLAKAYGLNLNDTIACPGGLHTMSGLRNNCILPILVGATLAALDAGHFAHPMTAAATCRRHTISVLSVVPAFIHGVRASHKPLAFGPLRQILCTGTSLTLNAQREVEQKLNVPIHLYYGLTETGGVCALLKPGIPRLADGDIGLPANAFMRLVDEEGHCLSEDGVVGEIEIYNTNLMLGYFDDPEASGARMREGWLRTGDMARIEEEHFILSGRIDDLFKTRQGLTLYPSAIEELLCTHEDVAEAVVIGIDLPSGPRLRAWLIARHPTSEGWENELHTWLRRRLNPQHMPEHIAVVSVLPRASNGKIAREVLRQELRNMQ
jgi:acyl-coenzyme A synthetase/AMP-(fatty) acid ligase